MALRFLRFSQGLAQDRTTCRIWFGIATADDFESHDDITEEVGWLHLQPKWKPSVLWFKNDESRLNNHLSRLFVGGIRQMDVLDVLPSPQGLGPLLTGQWNLYAQNPDSSGHLFGTSQGAGTAILTLLRRFHPQTQSLWLTDIAHHHLAIAFVSLVADRMYRTNFEIGHSIKDLLEAHTPPRGRLGRAHKEKQILIEPIFAQWIQSAHGNTSYGFDVLLSSTNGPAFNAGQSLWLPSWLNVINENGNSLFLTISPGDFLVHHVISLGLHTATLILVKGALDARGSKYMPNKKDFGYSFPCDGSGRGGTCDISAWDAFKKWGAWLWSESCKQRTPEGDMCIKFRIELLLGRDSESKILTTTKERKALRHHTWRAGP
ncbi:hypothetical protein AMTR_s00076p00111250 [Amborella trichopoda]|uniref:Photosystem I n=1 Tax=Amborella trichopoda TaxID=13333 RepID=W1P9T5_AMBTC|nr:hypothetical protein AMTR_s00076p00111250 [Amborella trichopoda]